MTTGTDTVTFGTDPSVWAGMNGNDPKDEKAILLGHAKNKGWDKLSPAQAAFEAAKAHRQAEQHIGMPPDQVFKWPKDANDAEGYKALHTKLGVPEKPEGYDFKEVKFADGSDLDDEFINTLRKTLHDNNVPAANAPSIVKGVVQWMEGVEAGETATKQAAVIAGRAELDKSWGANKEANLFIAKQAVTKLGLPQDFCEKLENEVGYVGAMQTMLKLGQMMGEAKFVSSGGPAGGVLTREQAAERLDTLKRDPTWVAKVNNGDTKANEEFSALNRIVALGTG